MKLQRLSKVIQSSAFQTLCLLAKSAIQLSFYIKQKIQLNYTDIFYLFDSGNIGPDRQ